MAANEKMLVKDSTQLAELTVGELKAIVRALMFEQMLELLRDFENYLPDAETGWTVQPEVWAQVRAFIRHKTDEGEGKPE
ncbi:MAG: hypothetical protein HZC41_25730 [Chloroflexi bacterium]|nr:hypothetical protein [Chloroflexota bacterium]